MTPAFQHITVPVDGTMASERGTAFAIELVGDGGTVTFCSVVEPALVCLPAAGGSAVDATAILAVLDDDATVFCGRGEAQAASRGVAAEGTVLHGQCAEAIDALVRRIGCDAIVIGTHGRRGLARAVLGSVAAGVLRRSDVPVVTVHENDVFRTGPTLIALDRSPAARVALDVALGVASAWGMPVAVLHVEDPRRPDAAAASLLAGAAERGAARGVRVELILRQGDAVEEILKVAEDLESCMIALGTHGRSFLPHLLLGSVATAVIERAHVPVLAVRRTH